MRQILSCHLFPEGIIGAVVSKKKGSRVLDRILWQPFQESPFHSLPVGAQIVEGKALADAVSQLCHDLKDYKVVLSLPDAWIRSAVLSVDELPRKNQEVHDLIAWRLKKLLSVDPRELRFSQQSMVPDSKGDLRLLTHFSLDKLLAGIEGTYEAFGVRVGCITSSFWSLAQHYKERDSWGLLTLEEGIWSLGYFQKGDLLFYRQRLLPPVERESMLQEIERSWSYFHKRWSVSLNDFFIWHSTGVADLSTPELLAERLGWSIQGVNLRSMVQVDHGNGLPDLWPVYDSVIIGAACRYV